MSKINKGFNLRVALPIAAGALLLTLGLGGCNPFAGPGPVTEVPWAQSGYWMVADLHTHTRFSDGGDSVDELVQRAVDGGCEVLAITDHSQRGDEITTASPRYFSTIAAARRTHPDLVLFDGIEWNIPQYGGNEHVGVLVDPTRAAALLGDFREKFDDTLREQDQRPDPRAAMEWLRDGLASDDQAVMFYHHPSRKRANTEQARNDLELWSQMSPLLVGFEGAPGHQRDRFNGSYRGSLQTQDRWDPLAATIGGGWDQLLANGDDLWGALASSDFHESRADYSPCEFSRVHVQVPERSAAGVLRGLRAGSFWADHGRILDRLKLVLTHSQLALPATPGETVRVPGGEDVRLGVLLRRGPGAQGKALNVELIGNCGDGDVTLLQQATLAADATSTGWDMEPLQAGADGRSCYVRARVRLPEAAGPDLLAYTNPIRIRL